MTRYAVLRHAHLLESTTSGRGLALDLANLERIDQELIDLFDHTRRRFADGRLLGRLHDRTTEVVLQGGKRLRPRLCLASYRIMTGASGLLPTAVIRAAASLEIFHAFMLVHDDLVDHSVTRRNRPTLHEVIRLDDLLEVDAAAAGHLGLLGGDLLCTLGMKMLGRAGLEDSMMVKAYRIITDMLIDTGLGEALDVLYGDRDLEGLSEVEITEAYVRKTARYSVSGPLVLGATLAGAPPRATRALGTFGDQLGFGYQIRNDLDGLTSDLEQECPDLDGGKRTFVLWTAYRRLDDLGRRSLDAALAMPVGVERRTRLLTLIRQSGAEKECGDRLRGIRRNAVTALRHPALESTQRRAFSDLLAWFGPGKTPSSPHAATIASTRPVPTVFAPEVQG